MAEDTNKKEFLALLETVLKQQQTSIPNSNGETYKFHPLTANQLKELVQTLADTSLTNLSFNSAVVRIMKENFIKDETLQKKAENFNILDKILFILSIRIQAVADKVYILDDNQPVEIDLNDTIEKLKSYAADNKELLEKTTITDNNINIVVGLPLATTDLEVNNHTYKNLKIKSEDEGKLEETKGKAFIAEIVKWIQTIVIENTILNFADLNVEEKVKLLESLPASAVEKILVYIETAKQNIQDCLSYSNKVLPLDGSLFSIR